MAQKTAAYIGAEGVVAREDVVANCDYIGEGYGIPTQAMREALSLLARLEGLLVPLRGQSSNPWIASLALVVR